MVPAFLSRAALLAALALPALSGCSSVRSAAVATGPVRLPPRAGAIQIHSLSAPQGATELGVVQVTASGEEATVDQMLPIFVQRVAQLGGNAAVVESVRGRFDVIARPYMETYYYACGFRSTCAGMRMIPAADEVLTVVMSGRAALVKEAAR